MPVFNYELKVVTCSDVLSYFRSWHVGAAHDSNEHVEKMNDHEERWNGKDDDEKQHVALVADEETVIIEFSEREEPHIPEWTDNGVVSHFNIVIFSKCNVVEPDLVLSHNVETLSCGKDRDYKDEHEKHDIIENLEYDVYKRWYLIKKRKDVDDLDKQQWNNNQRFISNPLHLIYSCVIVIFIIIGEWNENYLCINHQC